MSVVTNGSIVSGDGIASIPLGCPIDEGVCEMAGESPVDISPNVANGILTASHQAYQAAMADGVRAGTFNMGALSSVALKNLDEVGAVESSATEKVLSHPKA